MRPILGSLAFILLAVCTSLALDSRTVEYTNIPAETAWQVAIRAVPQLHEAHIANRTRGADYRIEFIVMHRGVPARQVRVNVVVAQVAAQSVRVSVNPNRAFGAKLPTQSEWDDLVQEYLSIIDREFLASGAKRVAAP